MTVNFNINLFIIIYKKKIYAFYFTLFFGLKTLINELVF